jgi:RNA polymerase sigma factor (sigma-70 family)
MITIGADHSQPDLADDSSMVEAWAAGDQRAYERAYRTYYPVLLSFAMSRLGDPTEAHDIVHDSFLRAARRIQQLRDPSRLRPWLYAIVRNRIFNQARLRSTPRPADEVERSIDAGADHARQDPAEITVGHESSWMLWRAAGGLSERDRRVLVLHVLHGLDGAQLAASLEVDRAHGYVLVSRMKHRLAECVTLLATARMSHRECSRLGHMLESWNGSLTPTLRAGLLSHFKSCPTCSLRWSTRAAAADD